MMTKPSRRYFEDIEIGVTSITGPYEVREPEVIEFAKKYDPAYFHLDAEKAKESVYGGLIASGAHVFAIYYNLCYQRSEKYGDMDAVATLGFEIKYPTATRPGDSLYLHFTSTEKRESKSNPKVGIAKNSSSLVNQKDEVVLEVTLTGMYNMRPA